MAKNVKIGTCGFRNSQQLYAESLSTVEIQHTFYQPPQIKTLEKWRAEIRDDFEFTLKAWQLITHESTSPTYKRLKKKLTEQEAAESGFFKPTSIVKEALDYTLACADALKARFVLFQCPAKFRPTEENIENLSKFVRGINRPDLHFGWEPRGKDWTSEMVREICEDLGLWHVVDPFATPTTTPQNCYYRLHGIPRWRYTYEDVELEELISLLPNDRLSYVFFNNVTMRQDAVRFEKILRDYEAESENL
jgi:uncharacterized protein YecE (DUF72 family)